MQKQDHKTSILSETTEKSLSNSILCCYVLCWNIVSERNLRQLERDQGIAIKMIRVPEKMTYKEKSEHIELFAFKEDDWKEYGSSL